MAGLRRRFTPEAHLRPRGASEWEGGAGGVVGFLWALSLFAVSLFGRMEKGHWVDGFFGSLRMGVGGSGRMERS